MREKSRASVAFDNFITQILHYFFHSFALSFSLAADGSWFLLEFTTGNSCNECHMCNYPPQSSKKLTNDLHLLKPVSVSMDVSWEPGRLA